MDDLEKRIAELESELNEQCEVLIRLGRMPRLEPGERNWEFYSSPIDDVVEPDELRAVLEAGRLCMEATFAYTCKNYESTGNLLNAAFEYLRRASSASGKKQRIHEYRVRAGRARRDEAIHFAIYEIADDLLAAGHSWTGLARKVSDKLAAREIYKDDTDILKVLKSQKTSGLFDSHCQGRS